MKIRIVLWVMCLFFVFPTSAHAYLDPGTGSMILQALAAVLVTCMVFVQGIRRRIISFFQRLTKKDIGKSWDDENKGQKK